MLFVYLSMWDSTHFFTLTKLDRVLPREFEVMEYCPFIMVQLLVGSTQQQSDAKLVIKAHGIIIWNG